MQWKSKEIRITKTTWKRRTVLENSYYRICRLTIESNTNRDSVAPAKVQTHRSVEQNRVQK